MKRYLKLYWYLFRSALMMQLEYRFNFFLWSAIDFAYMGASLVFVNLIFGQITAVAGWNKQEFLILTCTMMIVNDVLWAFVFPNMENLSHLIRHGELDFMITKPVSSRIYASIREIDFDHFLRIGVIFILMNRFLGQMGLSPSLTTWFIYLVTLLMAMFALYNLCFMIVTTNFWFIRLFNVTQLMDNTINLGRYPVGIFKNKIRFTLSYIIPVAFLGTFPTLILLGKGSLSAIWYLIPINLFTFAISNWFWHFALKRYSSASS